VPKWAPSIAEGQRLFTGGDVQAAAQKFKDALALGGPGKVFAEQTRIAAASKGRCKAVAFSRPRLATDRKGERPAIVTTPRGALVAWIDDNEQPGRDHVYSVMIDPTGKPIGPVRDLTPEATEAARPQLVAHGGDRTVLLYWDAKGRDAGVRVRALDGEGRIDTNHGQSVLVGAARPGNYWPAIERAPQGFFVVWQDGRGKEGDDLFIRKLTNDLDTEGPETRLTDYVGPPRSKFPAPRVRHPSVAAAANTLLVAYRLERERERLVMRMRVPLEELEKGGLPESKESGRASREAFDVVLVSEDKAPADAPVIACGQEGCFVVWHGEPSGAFVGLMDPNEGRIIWRKRFAAKGGRPVLAVNEGQVAVAYYEGGRIKMASLSRDGVSAPSPLLRIYDGSNPRASLAAGAQKNEWYLAWQDSDSPRGSAEVYAARVVCQ
jgi:eukaryotic-like serine/threonine-protein kinase